MNGWPAWGWLVLGVLLVLAELVVPSFFIFWFGLAACGVAAVVAILPPSSLSLQLGLWLIVSLLLVTAWFRWLEPRWRRSRVGASDAAVGEIGWVSEAIDPQRRGKVRFQRPVLGAEEWPAFAGESIGVGERVRVVAVEGQVVKVARVRPG